MCCHPSLIEKALDRDGDAINPEPATREEAVEDDLADQLGGLKVAMTDGKKCEVCRVE